MQSSQIHIIALTEAWLNSNILDAEVSLPGFSLFRRYRLVKKGGSVAVSKSVSQLMLCANRTSRSMHLFGLRSFYPNLKAYCLEHSISHHQSQLASPTYIIWITFTTAWTMLQLREKKLLSMGTSTVSICLRNQASKPKS